MKLNSEESDNSHIVGRGSFEVQESQVELNQVFLNENSLKNLQSDLEAIMKGG